MGLTITNNELRGYVGRFFGAGDTPSAFVGEQSDDVQRFVDEGKRAFYNNELAHQWSFLSATHTFHLVSGVSRYDLPADFAMLHGPLIYSAGNARLHPPIQITSAERVLNMINRTDSSGVPSMAAHRPKIHNEGNFLSGMLYELIVYPVPSENLDVDMRYKINPLAPTTSALLPIGDVFHVQTLIEACLAAVERFNGEFNGGHKDEFLRLLKASVSHDQQVSAPETLGINTDKSDGYEPWGSWRDLEVYTVTPPASWGTI